MTADTIDVANRKRPRNADIQCKAHVLKLGRGGELRLSSLALPLIIVTHITVRCGLTSETLRIKHRRAPCKPCWRSILFTTALRIRSHCNPSVCRLIFHHDRSSSTPEYHIGNDCPVNDPAERSGRRDATNDDRVREHRPGSGYWRQNELQGMRPSDHWARCLLGEFLLYFRHIGGYGGRRRNGPADIFCRASCRAQRICADAFNTSSLTNQHLPVEMCQPTAPSRLLVPVY